MSDMKERVTMAIITLINHNDSYKTMWGSKRESYGLGMTFINIDGV